MTIFVTIFLIGALIAVILIIMNFMGGLDLFGDVDLDHDIDFDHDIDLDHDMDFGHDMDLDHDVETGGYHLHGISPVSPFMISLFLMGFGLGGMFMEENYEGNDYVIYSSAAVIGLVIMAALRKAFRAFFVETQVNSIVRDRDLIGAEGAVTLRIPKGDIGEVAVITKMGRIKMAARAEEYIPSGSRVRVVKKVGNTLFVEAIEKVEEPEKRESVERSTASSETKKQETAGPGRSEETEESDFTFEAYSRKEEAKKPTIIYDQRKIIIRDSVVNRSDFSEVGGEEEPATGKLKDEMKKKLKDEAFRE